MIHHIITLQVFVVEINIQSYFYILHEVSSVSELEYTVCIIQRSYSKPMNVTVF